MSGYLERYGTFAFIFMIAVITGGAAMLVAHACESNRPIEILTPQTSLVSEMPTEVIIGGIVTKPGIYPLREGDTISSIIQAAGGLAPHAYNNRLTIYVSTGEEKAWPQRVNINTAETWLLGALPGIGPSRAQAIVNYRDQYGSFRQIEDLTKVEGISSGIFDKTKQLITVTD